MKSSGNSSATASPTPSAPRSSARSRRAFALAGRSADLDPRIHAVRPDLADVRLADRVFAPHYAEAVERTLVADTVLRLARDPQSEAIATVAAGERFELLDLIGDAAWGIVPARGLVGYLPAANLAAPGLATPGLTASGPAGR